jgi:uncharacterized membrane-anchored protein YjiN (DUF445 family)
MDRRADPFRAAAARGRAPAKFGRFIEDQILSWQEEKLVAELERHIGPDLQYIRINGTVVGAARGLRSPP